MIGPQPNRSAGQGSFPNDSRSAATSDKSRYVRVQASRVARQGAWQPLQIVRISYSRNCTGSLPQMI